MEGSSCSSWGLLLSFRLRCCHAHASTEGVLEILEASCHHHAALRQRHCLMPQDPPIALGGCWEPWGTHLTVIPWGSHAISPPGTAAALMLEGPRVLVSPGSSEPCSLLWGPAVYPGGSRLGMTVGTHTQRFHVHAAVGHWGELGSSLPAD